MSVYKVPQDVEAEDKLVGPFTLKQFIFLIVALISAYLTFVLGSISIVLVIIPLPFVIFFGILALPIRKDQPMEVYLVSLLQFHLKPRRKIWSQDGIFETVHITVPPRVEHHYTDGLSENQVNSQLRSLAGIMDTRGWAAKNASLQSPVQGIQSSDRLVQVTDLPNTMQPTEVHAADDIMDFGTNAVAQNMSQRANHSASQFRASAIAAVQKPDQYSPASRPQTNPQDYQAAATPFQFKPSPKDDPSLQFVPPEDIYEPPSSLSSMPQPTVSDLSKNDDWSVSAIAKKANKKTSGEFDDEGEISLR